MDETVSADLEPTKTFYGVYGLDENGDGSNLIISMYYALTTLSTVGYGDYVAISESEMIMSVCIQLMGIAIFSWIMSEARRLMQSEPTQVDKQRKLRKWIFGLEKNFQPVSTSLFENIDWELQYFWGSDRQECLRDKAFTSIEHRIKGFKRVRSSLKK